MDRLDGKVAIITGGARGQGAAEGELFLSEGARVVLTDVLSDEGEATAKRLGCEFKRHDVTQEERWSEIIAETKERYGRIDVLINNAGIFFRDKMINTSLADFDRLMSINTTGVFLGMKAVAPVMSEQGSGSIVNISSVAGLSSAAGAFAYGASKWAVRGMTKTAAVELARHGVRCNSIHPGLIETQMLAQVFEDRDDRRERMVASVPLGRSAEPNDIATLALFLASDESQYATGSEFVVDGGINAM
ncbi:MAG: glucose 1-dehydrogenase [Gammaproteobacteria bacterium]|nr:glucose 1-dehydrogenase [Gammaproteobacteria bacterium]